MGPRVDDLALVENDNAVGQVQCGTAMGDEDRGASDHEAAQGRVDLPFDPAVDRRCGVV